MSIFEFKKAEINNSPYATATVGERNVITVSQAISRVTETNITNEGQKWSDVVEEMTKLQQLLRDLPDEHEDVRDQELLPAASKAKTEAGKLKENPGGEKQGFLDYFKTVCDAVAKVADLAEKASPLILKIAGLIGIAIPGLTA